jgi:putative copper resistance protein D
MLETGLVGSRLVHFTCVIMLFGSALFVLYSASAGSCSERLARLLPKIFSACAIGALLSGVAWFLFAVGSMSGALAGAVDSEALSSVLRDTGFGRTWAARVVPMVIIVAMVWWLGSSMLGPRPIRFLVVLSAILLASLAGVGHTQVHEGVPAIVHVTADAIHLLAAGAWLGGLLPLGMVVVSCRMKQVSNDDAVFVLTRFSGMAYLAVAALVASGAINGLFLIGSWSALIGTSYGELLLLKLGLFSLMLCLAASNRFWLVPALAKAPATGRSNLVLRRLRRHIAAEQILGILVVGIVSLLGTLAPAIQGP